MQMNSLMEAKKQALVTQLSELASQSNEESLEYELSLFFQKVKENVLQGLNEYWPKDDEGVLLQGQLDIIVSPIFESQQEYYNILRKYNIKEYNLGCKQGRRLVNLARKPLSSFKSESVDIRAKNILNASVDKDELFGTNDWTEQKLLDQSFTASERTMNRVDQDINKLLSEGYASGAGIKPVAATIEKRFDQLKTWEARRIARTEIHNAHQMGIMNTYYEMGVQYTQWVSAHDGRTRDSHKKLNGEIIPLSGTFSNGCQFPGDTKGPLKEWINCRCGNVPFIIPDGYMAPPGMAQFRENNLISIDVSDAEGLLEYLQFDETAYAEDRASNEFVGWSEKLQRNELGGKLEMEQILTQESEGYTIDELLSEEVDMLEYWCEEGSGEISNVIYNGVTDDYAQDAIPILDDLIETSPGLNQHTKLYSGMILDESLEVGETGVLKGYQGTSFFEEGATPFARAEDRWLVEVYGKQGQKGICMNGKNGNGFTDYPHEHEYLLPRNQKYIIIEKNDANHTAKILLID